MSGHTGGSGRAVAAEVCEVSAGGIVYRIADGEPTYLLIRDSYRNWGFPKGHIECEEVPEEAALREVSEETGLTDLRLEGKIDSIDWRFRFRGKRVHKICHFFLMRAFSDETTPQRAEGITACRWMPFPEARRSVAYDNAREILCRANRMVKPDAVV